MKIPKKAPLSEEQRERIERMVPAFRAFARAEHAAGRPHLQEVLQDAGAAEHGNVLMRRMVRRGMADLERELAEHLKALKVAAAPEEDEEPEEPEEDREPEEVS